MTQEAETRGVTAAAEADWVARARKVAPLVAQASDETERGRRVPDRVMAALHEQALFRMLLPRSVNGGEATPLAFMEVMEVLGAADASTAWCLGQGLGCTFAAAYLDHAVAMDVFGSADAILAWGPPGGAARAVKVKGGYRATGRWRFASGSPHATWFGGHSAVFEDEQTPAKDTRGAPVRRTMLIPADKVTILDVWQVIGLRGTGSNDYEVADLFVPEAYTTWRDSEPDRREHGPLYSIPLLTNYGIGFAGIALGIARAMLDAFRELAETKVGGGMSVPLRENAVIQAEVARAEGRIASGRAFLADMIGETWETACRGDPFPMDQRARLRIAITGAIDHARQAVDFAYHAAGTNAIFERGPFERRFRDLHTLTQQGQAHLANFEFAGQALMGLHPGHRV